MSSPPQQHCFSTTETQTDHVISFSTTPLLNHRNTGRSCHLLLLNTASQPQKHRQIMSSPPQQHCFSTTETQSDHVISSSTTPLLNQRNTVRSCHLLNNTASQPQKHRQIMSSPQHCFSTTETQADHVISSSSTPLLNHRNTVRSCHLLLNNTASQPQKHRQIMSSPPQHCFSTTETQTDHVISSSTTPLLNHRNTDRSCHLLNNTASQPQKHRQIMSSPQQHCFSTTETQTDHVISSSTLLLNHRNTVRSRHLLLNTASQPQKHRQITSSPPQHCFSTTETQSDHVISSSTLLLNHRNTVRSRHLLLNTASQPQKHRQITSSPPQHCFSTTETQTDHVISSSTLLLNHRNTVRSRHLLLNTASQPQKHRQITSSPPQHCFSTTETQTDHVISSSTLLLNHRNTDRSCHLLLNTASQPQKHRQIMSSPPQHCFSTTETQSDHVISSSTLLLNHRNTDRSRHLLLNTASQPQKHRQIMSSPPQHCFSTTETQSDHVISSSTLLLNHRNTVRSRHLLLNTASQPQKHRQITSSPPQHCFSTTETQTDHVISSSTTPLLNHRNTDRSCHLLLNTASQPQKHRQIMSSPQQHRFSTTETQSDHVISSSTLLLNHGPKYDLHAVI